MNHTERAPVAWFCQRMSDRPSPSKSLVRGTGRPAPIRLARAKASTACDAPASRSEDTVVVVVGIQ